MSITLRVVIEGVCTLVPDTPFFLDFTPYSPPRAGNPSMVTVLLPNLREPGLASWNATVFRAPHWPILSFHMVDFDPSSTRSVDLVTRDLCTGVERGVILLDCEHLTLPEPTQASPFQADCYVPGSLSTGYRKYGHVILDLECDRLFREGGRIDAEKKPLCDRVDHRRTDRARATGTLLYATV